jgi:hypothetical protein
MNAFQIWGAGQVILRAVGKGAGLQTEAGSFFVKDDGTLAIAARLPLPPGIIDCGEFKGLLSKAKYKRLQHALLSEMLSDNTIDEDAAARFGDVKAIKKIKNPIGVVREIIESLGDKVLAF